MIKASLDFHDPIDIYDFFKSEYGPLTMLIRENSAFLTFEDPLAKKHILQNPKRAIKGYSLNLRSEEDDSIRKLDNKVNSIHEGLSAEMDLEDTRMNLLDSMTLGDAVYLPNLNRVLKSIRVSYQAKLKQIKERFLDPQQCNAKLNEFSTFLTKYFNSRYSQFQNPFRSLNLSIRKFSLNPQQELINLEQPNFIASNSVNYSRKNMDNLSAPNFYEAINYTSTDVAAVKRLCLLNESNFITSLVLSDKNHAKGQLRIYKKGKQGSEFSLDIQEGPYSLMTHQNFILTGDYDGHVHFIDLQNQNACEYSNRLNPGLILQMQKYDNKNSFTSMISLFAGTRDEYKIKLFQIQNQKISNEVRSLSFHPREQILCEGITLTMETLQNGKFAYGCGRNTYICPSFNKIQRDYITHDKNVRKIKMKNSQQLIVATETKIVLLDLRACRLKNQMFQFHHQLNNVQMLSEHYAFYGGKTGEVGVIDCRKPNLQVWIPSENLHRGKISDILRMGNDVISADGCGNIFQWKSQQFK